MCGALVDLKVEPYVDTTKSSLSSTQATTSFAYDAKSADVYAYRDPRYGDQSRALTNDSWSMSGTNPSGPVDPLGMYAELAGPLISSAPATLSSKTTSVREVSELFGDLSFPAELPGNDIGPPGYPRSDGITPLPRKPISSSLYPVPYANHSGGNNVLHELPTPPLSRHHAPSLAPSELPGCVSNSFRPASSVTLPEHHNRFMQTTSAESSQPNHSLTQSASATRMRHQKTYMDLLGSLDPN
ncbi:hypothetical protein K458DRAFT_3187 [Lentithecium fluviatile CBS 122367]|uniref:Uncharacterized protein n=1 Tax=Lentithecium fluviatile CBS 122367 TaxID=1168545 RepID=A0A6G1JN81_9PLEO|nr:hypothetical protein K458DRAFT_3187 [Lentithecium fluviatile CBS 122367]